MWRALLIRLRRLPSRLSHSHGVSTIATGDGYEGSLAKDEREVPDVAQVVVCGAGVVGASVAYHLSKVGFKDILLLEQGSIGGGTTWHAAGLLGQLRGTHAHTRMCMYGIDLYSRLEEETGQGTGVKLCGSLAVARNKDRLTGLKRLQSIGRFCGVESEVISPHECQKLCPMLRTDDLLAALWIPKDGSGSPSDICNALIRGALLQGVQVFEKVGVERVEVENGRVCGVRTNRGNVKCEIFVNCGGQWAREIGRLSDPVVNIPVQSLENVYIITKPMEGVDPMMPVVRDYCGNFYLREWSGAILAGGYEFRRKSCFPDGIPRNFEFQLLPEDWDLFQYTMEQSLHRLPALEHAEIRLMVNGPESFTPDMHAVLGESPQIRNYFVAAGQNAVGIASAAGMGRALAEWVAGGGPPFDLWAYDVARVDSHHCNNMFLNERMCETLGKLISIPWPKLEMDRARGVKQSPFHSRMEAAHASWGEAMGWELPNWFARTGNESRVNENTFGRPNWFDNVREEHLACRQSAAVFDLTSFSKFEIEGPETEATMQRLCTNNMAVPPGSVVHTGMLNQQGGYQTYCTVTRLSPTKYLVVCPSSQLTHMAAWISRHLLPSVSLHDVTPHYAVLALMGPRAREVLQRLTKTPLDNETFPYATAQYAVGVYDQVVAAGAEFGLRNAGWFALDSLRVENGYCFWGHDLDVETSPWEAQLGFTVDMAKGDFIGREELVKQQARGLRKMLASFTIDQRGDDNLLPWGLENIYRNGKLVGYVTSAVFSQTVGKPICMGYVFASHAGTEVVTPTFLSEGTYEIDIDGRMCPANISLTSLHEPKLL